MYKDRFYSIGVYSPRFQAAQSCEITLCKYAVLVAILVLHRGVQARVSALFFVSPMKCKLVLVGFFSDLWIHTVAWPWATPSASQLYEP